MMSNKTIEQWAILWLDGLSTSLIDTETAIKFIIDSALEYQAWGTLTSDHQAINDDGLLEKETQEITRNTLLTTSEWGVIKVLAGLFAERENALMQESSRVASHEPYGRSSSEVEQDILNFRNEHLKIQAFQMPIMTV